MTQAPLEFFRDLRAARTPQDASAKAVRQCVDARMAMRATLRAMRVKQRTVAEAVHKSEGYVSKIINGHEPMPDWFPLAFCYATGTNLLRQYIGRRAPSQTERLAAELRETAAA